MGALRGAAWVVALALAASLAAGAGACYVFPAGVPDPCVGVSCRHGARCVPSRDGRSASCRCPASCPDYGDHEGSRPVCASDGRTYRNQCELRRAACAHAADLAVRFPGKCDPCESVRCAPPEVCQLDADRQPSCRCGETCPLDLTPVCASDGRTYANECSLRQEACRTRRALTVLFRGKCSEGANPCAALRCGPEERCVVVAGGQARCECPEPADCEPVVRPVCGSDGRTYPSRCQLRRAACAARTAVAVAHAGACSGGGPCSVRRCEHGAECEERAGRAECRCPSCSEEWAPVCASDGISYGNGCKLRAEACRRGRRIVALYQGLCDGCENHKCSHYGICESDGAGTVRCICPEACDDLEAPVCGTDSITYRNECELRRSSCQLQKALAVAYRGACDLCEGIKCELGTHCESGKCTCVSNCTNSSLSPLQRSEPICASNGQTYANECEMRHASCSQPVGSSPLRVVFFGECRERAGYTAAAILTTMTTPSFYQSPVRQKIFIVSENERMLHHENSILSNSVNQERKNNTKMFSLLMKPGLAKEEMCQDVRCDFDAKCQIGSDGHPHCECDFNCRHLQKGEPVCASDKRVYPSLCEMKMESCMRKEELRLRPMDLCQGMKVKPCNGAPPLMNPITGMAYDCGSGPSRQDCPAGSYCHQTPYFARCCKKAVEASPCQATFLGCCPDGKTPIQGEGNAGCPSLCGCNKLGSISDACDPDTLQCKCKPGVGGVKCDRCEPGYWGLPKISEGHDGCLPCECSPYGAVREDCEQMTGRCMCRSGVQGQKCTVCTGHNLTLGPSGCVSVSEVLVPGTERPIRRSTTYQYTEALDVNLPIFKFTRHLLVPVAPDDRYFYHSGSLHQEGSDNNSDISFEAVLQPTPATVQLVIAAIGERCGTNSSCTIPKSHCISGQCMCSDGYFEAPDRQGCIAYKIPSFDGKSYIQLKRLKAYNKLSVELEFSTYTNNGIILYNQQKSDGTGDFVSLAVINGHVEFRYNLGSGPVSITSLERVQLGRKHHVIVKRYHRDGVLRLDGGEDVTGQTKGSLRALDLGEDAFIGYVPTNVSKVFENAGTEVGLTGCVYAMRLGQRWLELHEGRDAQVVRASDVRECGLSPCANLPCLHGGSCSVVGTDNYTCSCHHDFTGVNCENQLNSCASHPCASGSTCETLSHGGFTCKCPPGHSGKTCHKVDVALQEIYVPEFNGSSYIKLPKLEGVGRAFSIEMWFLSQALDGMLFYNGQMANGKGDFISLELINGHVQFQYDLGSGPANITSDDEIVLGKWHSVKVNRQDREGTLQLDNGALTSGESGLPLVELNLELPLYIGGIPSKDNTSVGLDGAVQQFIVNGNSIGDFRTSGLPQWTGIPCSQSHCVHGGVCQPMLQEYTCLCPEPYSGRFCENGNTVKPVKFDGKNFFSSPLNIKKDTNISASFNDSNVNFEKIQEESLFMENETFWEQDMYDENDGHLFQKSVTIEQRQSYEVVFRTAESNSLLLWLSNDFSYESDFFSLIISDGFVELHLTDDRKLVAKSKVYVSDGTWHTVTAHLSSLQVDSENPVRIQFNRTSFQPVFSTLWIGGAAVLPAGLPAPFYVGFRGCIDSIKVSQEQIELQHLHNNTQEIEFCDENDV
ncbi:agrin-like [Schistocerca gregaria]|uniref:agrin-like n=1 Tax=Schistocerca gregaria TaxID=7010 RepID=UPI00211ED79A|nr:agrin-like [Schistocerca gregaria]